MTETLNGEAVVNMTFPPGGGMNHDVRFKVPTDAFVVNASLDMEGSTVEWNGSFEHSSQGDFETGQATNVTISNGEISLDMQVGNIITPPGWTGADTANITIIDGNATISKAASAAFLPNKLVGAFSVGEDFELDVAVDPAGKIHVVYSKDMGTIEYMTSIDGGMTWTNPHTFGGGGVVTPIGAPKVFAGPNGHIHIFYHRYLMGGTQLIYKRSTDNGTTLNDVTWGFSALYPSVVWDNQGTMHFVGTISYPFPPFESYLYYWNSTDDGVTASTQIAVNDDPGNTAYKHDPDITVDSNGKLHIVWCDDRDGSYGDTDVLYSNSTDHSTFSPNWRISQDVVAGCNDSMIEVDSNDKLHVTWSDDRSGHFNVFYTNSTDSGSSFALEWPIHNDTQWDHTNPEIEVGQDDVVHVSWLDDTPEYSREIVYSNSSDGGTSFINRLRADDEDGYHDEPRLTLDAQGTPNFIWVDYRNGWNVYYTRVISSLMTEGELAGTIDLGIPPASLDRALTIASMPVSTDVEVMVRTSPDNTTWSGWEAVQLDDSTITSPPARYIGWKVHLHGTLLGSPSVTNLTVQFSYYLSEGEFLSAKVITDHPINKATTNWEGEHIDLLEVYLSNDNGTNMVKVENGVATAFAEEGSELRYLISFVSPGNVTPVLSSIKVTFEAIRGPTNISIDLGSDSVIDWHHVGPLTSKETVYFTDALATYLDNYEGTETEVLVVLRFTSETMGDLSVTNIAIRLDLPPVIHDHTPMQSTVIMDEGSSLEFKVNASDPDGGALTYMWYLDGTEVVGTTGSIYNHTTTYDDEGTYIVRVDVSDGRFTVNRTWTLTVKDINRPPQIVTRLPKDHAVTVERGDALTFDVEAMDPDGDALGYVWKLDGTTVPGAGNDSYILDSCAPTLGSHNITLEVTDSVVSVSSSWNLSIIEGEPPFSIASLDPADKVLTVDEGKKVDLKVEVNNPDQVTLTFSWYLDGSKIEGTDGKEYTFKAKKVGKHELKVVVLGEGCCKEPYQLENAWSITVKKRSQDGVESDLMTWLLLILVIIVVVIVLVLILMTRGKKKDATAAEATEEDDEGTGEDEEDEGQVGEEQEGTHPEAPVPEGPEEEEGV